MWNVVWQKRMTCFKEFPFEPGEEVWKLRIRVNTTSKRFRVRLSNEYDSCPLKIAGLKISADGIHDIPITFSGKQVCEVSPGSKMYSDAAVLSTKGNYLYLKIQAKTQQICTQGHTSETNLTAVNGEGGYYFGIDRVEADEEKKKSLLCFFGDSLTDQGFFSGSFTECLYKNTDYSTYNCGISGNRLLRDADSKSPWASSFGEAGIKRFEKDVFDNVSPKIVIVMIGINDLYHPGNGSPIQQLPETKQLVNGMRKLMEISEAYGTLCVPCTISPFRGTLYEGKEVWDIHREKVRNQFNHWIRQQRYYLDVDQFVRAEDPQRLNKDYDCGDHMHFSPEGGRKLGVFMYKSMEREVCNEL